MEQKTVVMSSKYRFLSAVVGCLAAGLLAAGALHAQQPVFRAELKPDTVLMDNLFEVRFVLEGGGECSEFVPPPFADFDIVNGPNLATSIRMVNGRVSQSQVWSYVLSPRSEGLYYIGPASVRCSEDVLETDPIEVWVMPNPDGIRRPIPSDNPFDQWLDDGFRFDFRMPTDPFEDFEELFRQMQPPAFTPAPRDSVPALPEKPRNPQPPKRKRKVYRI